MPPIETILHWKDTLSKKFCTNRQRQYVQTLKSRGRYTPQIIVNGRHEMVRSRNADIRRAIAGDFDLAGITKPVTLNFVRVPGVETQEMRGGNTFSDGFAILGKINWK